jgi:transposase-like protein
VSEKKRTYRQFTPEQKTEIVLAGIRADRSVRDVCREHEISEALYYDWRDRLLEGGRAALTNPRSRTPEAVEVKELRKRISQLERALGRKTYELEVAGNSGGTGRERSGVQSPPGGRCRTPPCHGCAGRTDLTSGGLPHASETAGGRRTGPGRSR